MFADHVLSLVEHNSKYLNSLPAIAAAVATVLPLSHMLHVGMRSSFALAASAMLSQTSLKPVSLLTT